MKAIRLHARDGPEHLVFEDAPEPVLGSRDSLVRVYACAVTPTELSWTATYTSRDGKERMPAIPGHEFSGRVVTVAPDVTDVQAGDAVYSATRKREGGFRARPDRAQTGQARPASDPAGSRRP